jgi:hypothetical protein
MPRQGYYLNKQVGIPIPTFPAARCRVWKLDLQTRRCLGSLRRHACVGIGTSYEFITGLSSFHKPWNGCVKHGSFSGEVAGGQFPEDSRGWSGCFKGVLFGNILHPLGGKTERSVPGCSMIPHILRGAGPVGRDPSPGNLAEKLKGPFSCACTIVQLMGFQC